MLRTAAFLAACAWRGGRGRPMPTPSFKNLLLSSPIPSLPAALSPYHPLSHEIDTTQHRLQCPIAGPGRHYPPSFFSPSGGHPNLSAMDATSQAPRLRHEVDLPPLSPPRARSRGHPCPHPARRARHQRVHHGRGVLVRSRTLGAPTALKLLKPIRPCSAGVYQRVLREVFWVIHRHVGQLHVHSHSAL
jgi:hypothetical protein